jgi:N-acetylmuramoyl-L-alanine amidase
MPKIYLSPAYHKWNPCAISGCDETTHNNQYLDELEVYLKACGIEYKRGTRRVPKSKENGTTLMNKAIKESNAWKPDIHYVSHTNASKNGTAKGYRPMIYPKNNDKGEKLAEILIKYRKEIYKEPINLKRTDEWAELRETVAVAYYEEHVFHDNKEDAKWFHDNMRLIAQQTCKGFCEYFGIKFVDPYAVKEEPKTDKLYRVQVGAYKVKANAEKMQKKLKELGIDAIIV